MIRMHKIHTDRVIFHNDVFSNISYCLKGKSIHSANEHDTENETDASARPQGLHVHPLIIQLCSSTLLCFVIPRNVQLMHAYVSLLGHVTWLHDMSLVFVQNSA